MQDRTRHGTYLIDLASPQPLLDVVAHALEVVEQEERDDDDHHRNRDLPEAGAERSASAPPMTN